ncbi:hypothetical protein G9A89_000282 [Geosiphon pyriformis]|nr:hypothetical protein G9A89_000282 [Geosiphon pyriformis]
MPPLLPLPQLVGPKCLPDTLYLSQNYLLPMLYSKDKSKSYPAIRTRLIPPMVEYQPLTNKGSHYLIEYSTNTSIVPIQKPNIPNTLYRSPVAAFWGELTTAQVVLQQLGSVLIAKDSGYKQTWGGGAIVMSGFVVPPIANGELLECRSHSQPANPKDKTGIRVPGTISTKIQPPQPSNNTITQEVPIPDNHHVPTQLPVYYYLTNRDYLVLGSKTTPFGTDKFKRITRIPFGIWVLPMTTPLLEVPMQLVTVQAGPVACGTTSPPNYYPNQVNPYHPLAPPPTQPNLRIPPPSPDKNTKVISVIPIHTIKPYQSFQISTTNLQSNPARILQTPILLKPPDQLLDTCHPNLVPILTWVLYYPTLNNCYQYQTANPKPPFTVWAKYGQELDKSLRMGNTSTISTIPNNMSPYLLSIPLSIWVINPQYPPISHTKGTVPGSNNDPIGDVPIQTRVRNTSTYPTTKSTTTLQPTLLGIRSPPLHYFKTLVRLVPILSPIIIPIQPPPIPILLSQHPTPPGPPPVLYDTPHQVALGIQGARPTYKLLVGVMGFVGLLFGTGSTTTPF